MEALAPGPIDPTNIASVELIEMRKQKNQRLQKMRNQERQNAMQKAKEYRERLQDARVALKQRAATEEAERRDEELRLVAEQLKLQLETLGQAQLDAAEEERRMEEEARRREARLAALEKAQRLRSSMALAKERTARSEQAEKIEAKKELRSSILAAEREKASRMAEQMERSGAVERDEAEKLAEEEERRRRAHLHSHIDYRFTRLHEGQGGAVPFVEVVEGPRYRNPYDLAHPLPDPAEEAAREEARLFEIECKRAEAASLAQERAQKRYEAAQTRIRNERLKKEVEDAMEVKAAEEIQRRKNAVLLGRGELVDGRKQREMERIFEDNFFFDLPRQKEEQERHTPVVDLALPQPSAIPQRSMEPEEMKEREVDGMANQREEKKGTTKEREGEREGEGNHSPDPQPRAVPQFLKRGSSKSLGVVVGGVGGSVQVRPGGIKRSSKARSRSISPSFGPPKVPSSSSSSIPPPSLLPQFPPLPELPYWSNGRNSRLGSQISHSSRQRVKTTETASKNIASSLVQLKEDQRDAADMFATAMETAIPSSGIPFPTESNSQAPSDSTPFAIGYIKVEAKVKDEKIQREEEDELPEDVAAAFRYFENPEAFAAQPRSSTPLPSSSPSYPSGDPLPPSAPLPPPSQPNSENDGKAPEAVAEPAFASSSVPHSALIPSSPPRAAQSSASTPLIASPHIYAIDNKEDAMKSEQRRRRADETDPDRDSFQREIDRALDSMRRQLGLPPPPPPSSQPAFTPSPAPNGGHHLPTSTPTSAPTLPSTSSSSTITSSSSMGSRGSSDAALSPEFLLDQVIKLTSTGRLKGPVAEGIAQALAKAGVGMPISSHSARATPARRESLGMVEEEAGGSGSAHPPLVASSFSPLPPLPPVSSYWEGLLGDILKTSMSDDRSESLNSSIDRLLYGGLLMTDGDEAPSPSPFPTSLAEKGRVGPAAQPSPVSSLSSIDENGYAGGMVETSSIVTELSLLAKEGEKLANKIRSTMAAPVPQSVSLPSSYSLTATSSTSKPSQAPQATRPLGPQHPNANTPSIYPPTVEMTTHATLPPSSALPREGDGSSSQQLTSGSLSSLDALMRQSIERLGLGPASSLSLLPPLPLIDEASLSSFTDSMDNGEGGAEGEHDGRFRVTLDYDWKAGVGGGGGEGGDWGANDDDVSLSTIIARMEGRRGEGRWNSVGNESQLLLDRTLEASSLPPPMPLVTDGRLWALDGDSSSSPSDPSIQSKEQWRSVEDSGGGSSLSAVEATQLTTERAEDDHQLGGGTRDGMDLCSPSPGSSIASEDDGFSQVMTGILADINKGLSQMAIAQNF